MEPGLEKDVKTFEKKYKENLKRWAGFVDPEELDQLIADLEQLDKDSNAITDRFETRKEKLYTDTWKPLLEDLMRMIPNILGHVETIRKGARENIGALGKGQRGLVGYRSSMDRKNGIFERDA